MPVFFFQALTHGLRHRAPFLLPPPFSFFLPHALPSFPPFRAAGRQDRRPEMRRVPAPLFSTSRPYRHLQGYPVGPPSGKGRSSSAAASGLFLLLTQSPRRPTRRLRRDPVGLYPLPDALPPFFFFPPSATRRGGGRHDIQRVWRLIFSVLFFFFFPPPFFFISPALSRAPVRHLPATAPPFLFLSRTAARLPPWLKAFTGTTPLGGTLLLSLFFFFSFFAETDGGRSVEPAQVYTTFSPFLFSFPFFSTSIPPLPTYPPYGGEEPKTQRLAPLPLFFFSPTAPAGWLRRRYNSSSSFPLLFPHHERGDRGGIYRRPFFFLVHLSSFL